MNREYYMNQLNYALRFNHPVKRALLQSVRENLKIIKTRITLKENVKPKDNTARKIRKKLSKVKGEKIVKLTKRFKRLLKKGLV